MAGTTSWTAKYAGHPTLLIVALLGFASTYIIGYSKVYKPWSQRRKLQESEAYAEFLIQAEEEKDNK